MIEITAGFVLGVLFHVGYIEGKAAGQRRGRQDAARAVVAPQVRSYLETNPERWIAFFELSREIGGIAGHRPEDVDKAIHDELERLVTTDLVDFKNEDMAYFAGAIVLFRWKA